MTLRIRINAVPPIAWTAIVALLFTLATVPAQATTELRAGAGIGDITPPVGTPSAGYGDRLGQGMTGIHDPLLATAVAIDNGTKRIVVVGVDHLGYDAGMVAEVVAQVRNKSGDVAVEIYLSSSHTHAGGGAYLDIPGLGTTLAGKFDPTARQLYIDGAADAVLAALGSLRPARFGLGYGHAPGLNGYRGDWPPNVVPADDVAVWKVTAPDGSPIAVLFNFAAHATVLPGRENLEFSADFVGYARDELRRRLGESTVAVFTNGAQGDVSPRPPGGDSMFERCQAMGQQLASIAAEIWERTATTATVDIATVHHGYELEVRPTSRGLTLPGPPRHSELNLIVLDRVHAFVTIPGELSTIYDADIRRFGGWLGFEHTTILGLTNDAHGYIITPESWRHRTYESTVSFGGELYGDTIEAKVFALLHQLEPAGAYHQDQASASSLLAPP